MSESNININEDTIKFIQASIEVGVSKGIERAIQITEERKEKKNQHVYNNRLKNTRLLLNNYRNFIKSVDNTVFTEKDLETITVNELLNKIEDFECEYNNKEVIVESILKSRKKTEIMIKHIKKVVDFFIFDASQSDDDYKKLLADIVKVYFIDGTRKPKYKEMSDLFYRSERQINRDITTAVYEISLIMFGFDSVNRYF